MRKFFLLMATILIPTAMAQSFNPFSGINASSFTALPSCAPNRSPVKVVLVQAPTRVRAPSASFSVTYKLTYDLANCPHYDNNGKYLAISVKQSDGTYVTSKVFTADQISPTGKYAISMPKLYSKQTLKMVAVIVDPRHKNKIIHTLNTTITVLPPVAPPAPTVARLQTVYVPGTVYQQCHKVEIDLFCGAPTYYATDADGNLITDAEGNLGEPAVNFDYQTVVITDFSPAGLAAGVSQCRDIELSQVASIGCNIDGTLSDTCKYDQYTLSEAVNHANSEQPDRGANIVGLRETQEITKTSSTSKFLNLSYKSEYKSVGGGYIGSDDFKIDPCTEKDPFAFVLLSLTSESQISENTPNPDFSKAASPLYQVVNVDQTFQKYLITPQFKGEADYYNENKICLTGAPGEVLWKANVPKDVSDLISKDGAEPNKNCNFATVYPVGTTLYDIGKSVKVGSSLGIQEGLVPDSVKNISPDDRPTQLNPDRIFKKIGGIQ